MNVGKKPEYGGFVTSLTERATHICSLSRPAHPSRRAFQLGTPAAPLIRDKPVEFRHKSRSEFRAACMKLWLTAALIALASPTMAQEIGKAGEAVPAIPYESVPNFLKLPPDMNLGEAAGVA